MYPDAVNRDERVVSQYAANDDWKCCWPQQPHFVELRAAFVKPSAWRLEPVFPYYFDARL